MNKKRGLLISIALLALIGFGILLYVKNTNSTNNGKTNYEANKTSSQKENSPNIENSSSNETTNNNTSNDSITENTTPKNITSKNSTNTQISPSPAEEKLSAFSTKIYSNDSNRTKNMQISTTTLNGTIVKNGETFSFCNTLGPATSSKGYLEADIYDHDGNKKKGYGGGICQVSSTLYNAVLEVSNLTVIERHPHSNYVPYVPQGKDAAVAYGSYDFKFRNDTGNDVKILSSVTEDLVNVTIISLKPQ